ISYNSAFCNSYWVNFLQFLYIQLKICILNILFKLNKSCGPANFTYNTLIFVILLTTFIAIILLPFITVILLPFIAVITTFISVILLPNYNTFSFKVVIGCNRTPLTTKIDHPQT